MLLLLILSLFIQCFGEPYMIKIFGKVPYDDPANGVDSELQECIDDCFYNTDCILSYMDSNNHCLLYNYSTITILNVTETTRADGYYVAFKVDLGSTCPAKYQDVDYSGSIGEISYKWTRTETNWIITNVCQDPWKKFVRDDGVTVCLGAIQSYYGINETNAHKICPGLGYKLTGVASVEESVWMSSEIKRIQEKGNYWLDGLRTEACQTSKDCQDFTWSDGYTTGNAAIVANEPYSIMSFTQPFNGTQYAEDRLSVGAGGSWILNDIPDDYTQASGVFCGFQMLNN